MIIVAAARPNNRPPTVGGPPLESGDVWLHSLTGVRQRYDGTAWSVYAPEIIVQAGAPSVRPAANGGGPLQIGDIWFNASTSAQAYWNGVAWDLLEPTAGIVPGSGRAIDHLAKRSDRSFDMHWVDPTDGLVVLYEQRAAAQVWNVQHDMRCTWVAVTVVDNTRSPAVVMVPDIRYYENLCELYFATPVSGFAVIHASKRNADIVIQ